MRPLDAVTDGIGASGETIEGRLCIPDTCGGIDRAVAVWAHCRAGGPLKCDGRSAVRQLHKHVSFFALVRCKKILLVT